MQTRGMQTTLLLAALWLSVPAGAGAQASDATRAATAAPRQSGTMKAVTPKDFVLTTPAGQDFAVTVPATVRILLVDPGTHDLKSARPGTMSDLAGGDKAIVIGTAGDTGAMLTASRVLLLKSGAIAALHAEQQAEWAHSIGGLVRSVDEATGTLAVVNGTRMLTIKTTPATVVRRYAGGSVRFEDAARSSVAAIRPGDQVQARGQRSPEGQSMTADEIVSGSFINLSGVLTAVDTGTGTITLNDLATKRPVTVILAAQTNLRRVPAGFGQGMAAHSGEGASAPVRPSAAAGGNAAGGEHAAADRSAAARAGSGRMDLSRILNRLPTETAADLKPGDAVVLVASRARGDENPTAITLVSGVGQILAASPSGQTTLSPWSLGSGEGEGGDAGGGPQ